MEVISTPVIMTALKPPVPRRLITGNADHAGVIIGPDPAELRAVRRWVAHNAHVSVSLNMDMRLVASELVTNTLRHTKSGLPDGQVTVEILHESEAVVLRVTDDGPLNANEWPEINANQGTTGETGRGLFLVSSLCAYWDWVHNNGKTVVSARFLRSE